MDGGKSVPCGADPVKEPSPTIGYKTFNYNKGFRSQSTGKVRDFCRLAKESIYPNLRFKLHHNSKYKTNDFLDLLTHAAMTHDFTENGSKTFGLIRPDSPSADTVLYHIKKFEPKEVMRIFEKTSDKIFEMAKSYGMFKNEVDLAIDYTDLPYYGDKSNRMIVGGKHHKGTYFSYRFITLNVVVEGMRFTLMALPRGPLSSEERLIRKLLECAKQHVMIRNVYLDRGFFNSGVINTFQELGIKFLMPAVTNPRVKKLVLESDVPSVHDYEMRNRNRKDNARFKIVVAEDEKKQIGAFATNMDVEEGREADLFTLYGKRWGIETSYRVKVDFRPRTKSKNYAVRLFYFLFSTCLYNLWVLANVFIGAVIGRFFTKPEITAKVFGTLLYTVPYWDDGG